MGTISLKMPKKKGRSNGAAKKGGGADTGSDDDTMFNDNASVISNASEQSYMRDDLGGGGLGGNIAENDGDGEDGGGLSQDEMFEEKLRDAIEMATQKSAAGRVNALDGIASAFGKKLIPDFVDARRMTITDVVEKSLK